MARRSVTRRTLLDPSGHLGRRAHHLAMDRIGEGSMATAATNTAPLTARLRSLHAVGILSGFAAGAWLGGAEAPTKLVTIGISPMVVSLAMVAGVFLARWTVPALIHGTSYVKEDIKQ